MRVTLTLRATSSYPLHDRPVILVTKLSDGWDWWQAFFRESKWFALNGQELIVPEGSFWAEMVLPESN